MFGKNIVSHLSRKFNRISCPFSFSPSFWYAIITKTEGRGLPWQKDRGVHRGCCITELEFEPYELRFMVYSIHSSKFITQTEANTISQKTVKLADADTKPTLIGRKAQDATAC